MMEIRGSVALVTGANRGLGRAFARTLLERGAARVYAGAREVGTVTDPDLVPVRLDITDPAQVAAAAARLRDVNVLINNAGTSTNTTPLSASLDDARFEIEVNYLGTLSMSQAFAPVLGANGGGALVNMLSVLSWYAAPRHGTYAAAKAASWSATNALRLMLREQGTLVVGVHAGYIDTDMASGIDGPKLSADEVAAATIDGVLAGEEEVIVDPFSRQVKASLHDDLRLLYPKAV